MDTSDLDERRRQIQRLLAYPKVGPLTAAAIAINLGTTETEIRDALESLLQDGRIMQMGDERFTSRSALSRERLAHQELPEAGRSGSR